MPFSPSGYHNDLNTFEGMKLYSRLDQYPGRSVSSDVIQLINDDSASLVPPDSTYCRNDWSIECQMLSQFGFALDVSHTSRI